MRALDDRSIRQSARGILTRRASRGDFAILLEEFHVPSGRTRADLVLVNGHLCGFEIKSDQDTLRRLSYQARHFSAVFDRMTLIVGWRYAAQAMRMVPAWWGVQLVEQGHRHGIRFSVLRTAKKNPEIDARALALLLWRQEMLDALTELDVSAPCERHATRAVLSQAIIDRASLAQLRRLVCVAIKKRRTSVA